MAKYGETQDEVVEGTTLTADDVVTETTADEVVTSATADEVVTNATADEVVTSATADEVVTNATADEVVTSATADKVVTNATADEVVTSATADKVVTNATADEVVTNATVDEVTNATVGSEEEHITTSRRPKIIDYHREKAEKLYGILSPIQISRKPKDLDEIFNCECPRVYWPVCSVDDITYVSACIANCLKVKIRREGPCVLYRRSEPITPAFHPE